MYGPCDHESHCKVIWKFIVVAAFAALFPRAASGYYGFSGDPAHRENWIESTLVPLNSHMLRMRQPDGVERILQRDPAQPEVLMCPEPWVGEVRGSKTIVMTDPEFSGGQTGFLFERGKLKLMILDGKEYNISGGNPATSTIGELWPEISEAMIKAATEANKVHWHGRLNLWYDNPNRAAMLIVEVLILLLAVYGLRGRLAIKLLALPLALLCFYGLVRTGSRGGMVALMTGLTCLSLFRLKALFKLRNLMMLALAVIALVAIVFFSGMSARFTSGLIHEGYTDVSRIPIWIEAPRMMVAASQGWGWGLSGDAYINWFQPLTRFHVPGGFLNTHLNVLVDAGWLMRFLYLFVWVFALVCFADDARRGRSALPFAIGAAFFVGSTFSSFGRVPSLWIVPAFVILVHLSTRPRTRLGEFTLPAFFAAAVSCLALGAFAFFGFRAEKAAGIEIHGDSAHVVVNGKNTTTWIVEDGQVLDGGYKGILGKDARHWYLRHKDANAVGFVKTLGDVPSGVRRLVLAGKACSAIVVAGAFDGFADLKEIVLISPPFGWREVPESVREKFRVKMVAGSFAHRLSEDSERPPEWVTLIPGCELYIPNWLRYAAN